MGEKQVKRGHLDAETTAKKKTYGTILLRLLMLVLVTGVILLNLFTYVFSVVHYYGNSMEPALQDRQLLLVRKTDKVGSGDIVAFYYNNKVLVRRIVAEGGTNVVMDDAGCVTVDGRVLDEPYVQHPATGQCNVDFPYTVPYDSFFVMGDNRSVSMDSRLEEIGSIPRNRVIGKVVLSLG